jgi:hypothetical protein
MAGPAPGIKAGSTAKADLSPANQSCVACVPGSGHLAAMETRDPETLAAAPPSAVAESRLWWLVTFAVASGMGWLMLLPLR